MLDYEKLNRMALEAGFTRSAPLKASTIELKQEVRDMCAVNTCGQYDKNWACPPGCGTLDECRERIAEYEEGILVQTTGDVEDSMDFEGIMAASEAHDEHFRALFDALRKEYPHMLGISAGSCKRCKDCTYPDKPCRFPELRTSSMEAYGMLVLEVCKANDLQYYYGPTTITYSSCFLIREEP
ncbi:MAG: DUF2284 domain-containing protein [Oscillospiraceae bacterium]|nr:DUF2284 domain-containing protein [Oscillospiraceae bacterium]